MATRTVYILTIDHDGTTESDDAIQYFIDDVREVVDANSDDELAIDLTHDCDKEINEA